MLKIYYASQPQVSVVMATILDVLKITNITQTVFQIVSTAMSKQVIPTAADIETTLARFGMLPGLLFQGLTGEILCINCMQLVSTIACKTN